MHLHPSRFETSDVYNYFTFCCISVLLIYFFIILPLFQKQIQKATMPFYNWSVENTGLSQAISAEIETAFFSCL